MSRPASEATQLRNAKREMLYERERATRALAAQMQLQHKLDVALKEVAEWKVRFDALLKHVKPLAAPDAETGADSRK